MDTLNVGVTQALRGRQSEGVAWRRPIVFGLLAALGLLTFYLGILTLAQGGSHALEQLAQDRWFVSAIVAGFGTQMGLLTYLRNQHVRAGTSSLVASSGMSTAAMLACCAHHLTDVLPILGLSGAAILLTTYKTPILWLGVAMNIVGIAYLLRKIGQQRAMACQASTVPTAQAKEVEIVGR